MLLAGGELEESRLKRLRFYPGKKSFCTIDNMSDRSLGGIRGFNSTLV
jgi:hypothetical protein